MKNMWIALSCLLTASIACNSAFAQVPAKHGSTSRYPTYAGRVVCGYQGWFRAEGDGSGEGWTHYSERGPLTPATLHPDFWPDVSEYEKTYPTVLTNQDGSIARVFSSRDQSTTDLHFRWMRQFGIDGVFVQRFFSGLRPDLGLAYVVILHLAPDHKSELPGIIGRWTTMPVIRATLESPRAGGSNPASIGFSGQNAAARFRAQPGFPFRIRRVWQ